MHACMFRVMDTLKLRYLLSFFFLITEFSSEAETSEESKLNFSEDEETLIIRMFNLVGER